MPLAARSRRWETWAVGLAALAAHGASIPGGFLGWDDDRYITRNPFVQDPSWDGLIRLFGEPYYANYHPLHVASYAIDRALFGDAAWGYHLLNVLYFAAGAALVAAFLRRAFPGERWPTFAALLFAVHPVHVESVAWLSARKDVLALLFGMAYAVCHVRSHAGETARARAGWYAAGFCAFALALLSKAIVAPLPLVLLAHDRLLVRRRWPRALAAALPHVALAAALLAVAYEAQAGAQAVKPYPGGSLATGMLTASTVVARYVGLLLVPQGLSAVYDVEPRTALADPAVLGALALLGALAALALVAWRRGTPLPLYALLWFALPLAPVSGVVSLSHLMADRYLLFPALGYALVLAWGGSRLAARGIAWRRAAWGAGALAIALYLQASAFRALEWHDDLSLWSGAVVEAPRDPVAHVNFGAALADAGRLREAAAAFARALELRPATPQAARNLRRAARALERRGDRAGAEVARRLLAATPLP